MKFKKYIMAASVLMMMLIAGCGGVVSADGAETFKSAASKNTYSKINVQILKLLVEDQTKHEVDIVEDLPSTPQIFAGIEREEFDFASLFSGEVYNNYFDDIEYTT